MRPIWRQCNIVLGTWSVVAKFRCVASYVFVRFCDHICTCRWICISVQFLYFCICDDAECSWRCVANPELNYGEIMQPPNQPASIILSLYQSSKSECSLCSVENDLDISLEKISATGWAPKVCCTEKVSLKVSQKGVKISVSIYVGEKSLQAPKVCWHWKENPHVVPAFNKCPKRERISFTYTGFPNNVDSKLSHLLWFWNQSTSWWVVGWILNHITVVSCSRQ